MAEVAEVVEVRLFAAARHAVGTGRIELADVDTVAAVLDALVDLAPEASRVISSCSVLVDGERRDRSGRVPAGATVDVLPPFAGG